MTLLVTLPGEPLVELGWQVYNDTLKLGFDNTFLCGYTNNHMGYFATPNEYGMGVLFLLYIYHTLTLNVQPAGHCIYHM